LRRFFRVRPRMCNLYSITTNQDAIRRLFAVTRDMAGNLPSMPGVFPDQEAPVVRNHGSQRELIKMRWGMPPPPKVGGPPITNIRNMSSPHWRGWLRLENRCLVPASSFSEYAPDPNTTTGKKDIVCVEPGSTAVCVWWGMDLVQRRPWSEIEACPGSASRIWISDDRTQRSRCAHPFQGHAGHLDHERGARCLDARTME
jgi:putative SOS response-associated peptidase YedK